MDSDDLDLVSTDELVDALSRRFDSFVFVSRKQVTGRRGVRELQWGGELEDATRMTKYSNEYLHGRLDERNSR